MTASQNAKPERKIHPALKRSYWLRALAYPLAALLVINALPSDQKLVTGLVIFFGFFYPTLFYQMAIRTNRTRELGFAAYSIDSFLWSLAVVATHYSISILLLTPQLAIVSSVLMLGLRRGLFNLVIVIFVLLSGLYFVEVELLERFSAGQGIYTWFMVMAFMFYIALLVNLTTRDFVAARHQLQEKNSKVMEQAEQLESIGNVARLVNSTLDIDQVMQTIMERLNNFFSFTHTGILFLDKQHETLNLDRMGGDLPDGLLEILQELHIPLTEEDSAFTIAALSKVPVYLPDVQQDAGASKGISAQIYQLLPAKSLIIYPLIKDNEAVGVIAFANIQTDFYLEQHDIDHIGQYVTYIVSALRNASDYREIQESRAAADDANKAKSQFLANMSHELRTPMNAVIGYSEMLEEEAEDLGQDQMVMDLRKVLSASHHLLKLINDVLDLSKVEAGKLELHSEKIAADSLLADIEATSRPLIEKNENELLLDKTSELGELYLDQTKLRQIILNLLSNAAKFTNKGTIHFSTERIKQADGDWLEINVTDSGIGMTKEQLERVFDPFSQAEASTTREYGGTGLGLSISRRLCEMMGGTLTAKSELGVGSTFTIRIPVESGDVTAPTV